MSTPDDDTATGSAGTPGGVSRPDDQSSPLHDLAAGMADIRRAVDAAGGRLEGLAEATLQRMPGAHGVSVSILDRGSFRTGASTHDWAADCDNLQYELGHGPCVDAVLEQSVFVSGEVAADPRWPDWGARVLADHGVNSVLAHRLVLHGGQHTALASLNTYSRRHDAFDDASVQLSTLLAAHGALLVSALMARDAADDLAASLKANREVGVAMGVLMHRHRVTRDEAFDLIRVASQASTRSLEEVAAEVVETGEVPVPDAAPEQ